MKKRIRPIFFLILVMVILDCLPALGAKSSGRKAVAYLPTLEVKNKHNRVIQVIDESNNEIVYTLRINGRTFRPKVFHNGTHTVNIGQRPSRKSLHGIKTIDPSGSKTLTIAF